MGARLEATNACTKVERRSKSIAMASLYTERYQDSGELLVPESDFGNRSSTPSFSISNQETWILPPVALTSFPWNYTTEKPDWVQKSGDEYDKAI